jgi:hypothetical protein
MQDNYFKIVNNLFNKANKIHSHSLSSVNDTNIFINLLGNTSNYINQFSDASHVMELSGIVYDRDVYVQFKNFRVSAIIDYFTNILDNHSISYDRILGSKNTFNVYVSGLSSYLLRLNEHTATINAAPSSNHKHNEDDLYIQVGENSKINQLLSLASEVRDKFFNLKAKIKILADAIDSLYGPCLYSYNVGKQMLKDYGYVDNTSLSVNTLTLFNNVDDNHSIAAVITNTVSAHTLETKYASILDINTDIYMTDTLNVNSVSTNSTYVGSLTTNYLLSKEANIFQNASFENLYSTYITTPQLNLPFIQTFMSNQNFNTYE